MRISDWSSDVCSSDLAVFAGIAVSAHELHRIGGDRAGDLVGETFGDRGFLRIGEAVAGVGRRAVDEQPCRLDLARHVAEALLHRLEIDQRLHALPALLNTSGHPFERAGRHPPPLRGVAHPPDLEKTTHPRTTA